MKKINFEDFYETYDKLKDDAINLSKELSSIDRYYDNMSTNYANEVIPLIYKEYNNGELVYKYELSWISDDDLLFNKYFTIPLIILFDDNELEKYINKVKEKAKKKREEEERKKREEEEKRKLKELEKEQKEYEYYLKLKNKFGKYEN